MTLINAAQLKVDRLPWTTLREHKTDLKKLICVTISVPIKYYSIAE